MNIHWCAHTKRVLEAIGPWHGQKSQKFERERERERERVAVVLVSKFEHAF